MTSDEILAMYKGHDMVERNFGFLKDETSSRWIGAHTEFLEPEIAIYAP
jgi:hypothetical protein